MVPVLRLFLLGFGGLCLGLGVLFASVGFGGFWWFSCWWVLLVFVRFCLVWVFLGRLWWFDRAGGLWYFLLVCVGVCWCSMVLGEVW